MGIQGTTVSVIFGKWNFDGQPATEEYLHSVRSMLIPYAPDGAASYLRGGISILYHAFHTTGESRQGLQPLVTNSASVITFDGRLDNRQDLIARVGCSLAVDSPDVAIVATAYERFGTTCFAGLLGDWALSIWNPTDRSVILAKDPVGSRHLYYQVQATHLTWCTILDPIVTLAGKPLKLDEEYIAGLLSFFPAACRTPYAGIQSVPPSSLIRITPTGLTTARYWDFDPSKRIRHRTDADYEEHFRVIFGQSVRRRMRSDAPIVAELSGGIDSSSIVCMADALVSGGNALVQKVDTVSYYDDSEPDWDERPYFAKVEQKRGRTGCHISIAGHNPLIREYELSQFPVTPWSALRPSRMSVEFTEYLKASGSRVVLSGLGGDETLGGVPAPLPELADLLTRGHLLKFGQQIVHWALAKRLPVSSLFADTIRSFLPPCWVRLPEYKHIPNWINSGFARKNRAALMGYESRRKLIGPLPSFQENLAGLEALRRQLACSALPNDPPYEKRYPYLDRDLLEFIYAIPRDQIVRPSQRRSLMRRSLAGMVPDEVLNRRRKAVVSRGPRVAIASNWASLQQITENMESRSLGFIDAPLFREALEAAQHEPKAQLVRLMRALEVEMWLRTLTQSHQTRTVRITSLDNARGEGNSITPPFKKGIVSAEANTN